MYGMRQKFIKGKARKKFKGGEEMRQIKVFSYRNAIEDHIVRWWVEGDKVKIRHEHIYNGLKVKEEEIEIPQDGLIIEDAYEDEIERKLTIYLVRRNSKIYEILFDCAYDGMRPHRGECSVCSSVLMGEDDRFCSRECREKYEKMIKLINQRR